MKKIFYIVLLTIICTLGSYNISEAKLARFDINVSDDNSWAVIYYDAGDNLSIRSKNKNKYSIIFNIASPSNYYIFDTNNKPIICIDDISYTINSNLDTTISKEKTCILSSLTVSKIPSDLMVRIASSSSITFTITPTNAPPILIKVSSEKLANLKTLLNLSLKNS